MKRLPWMKMRKKTDPEWPYEPPIFLGNKSNGEFFHEQTAQDRKIRKEILRRGDENARKLGIDRREFMASAMGMATSLAVLNLAAGCGSESKAAAGTGGGSDGGYDIPKEAGLDCGMATTALAGDEFILDMQTHHIEDEQVWRDNHPGRAYAGEGYGAVLTFYDCVPKAAACIQPDAYLNKIFLESETTVSVLSGFPSPMCEDDTLCTNPNGNDDMVRSRDRINEASGSVRVIQHCQVCPNDQWDRQARMMETIRTKYGNHGWKVYPPWGPGNGNTGWWLDDPVVADPFIEHAKSLGDPIVCLHKGFPLPGFDKLYANPKDVGPAAVKHPDVTFVIYHSAFDTASVTDPDDVDLAYPGDDVPTLSGTNRLIRTVNEHQLKGKNVYAEMGSAWVLSMNDPIRAQHYVGKLVKYLGEDNVVWGSECLWFGSPQPQIEAFRKLEISQEFQDKYGYAPLTKEVKAKIFGRNAARLYKLDPDAIRCTIDTSKFAEIKRELDGELGGRRWALQEVGGPRTRREFFALNKWRKFLGTPA